jgi:hypothetical protein
MTTSLTGDKLVEKVRLLERKVADAEHGAEQQPLELERQSIVFDQLTALDAEIQELREQKADQDARLLVAQAQSLELAQKGRKIEKRAASVEKLKAALADGDPVKFKAALVEIGGRDV